MFTPELVTEILALATVVLAITQAVKKWLKLDGYKALMYLLKKAWQVDCSLL